MTTTTTSNPRKMIPSIPPIGWRKEMPVYRISQETLPAPKERFRFEPPFSSLSEHNIWQYGERVHKAGEIIATDQWPNAGTFTPLNFSAREVMQYFTMHQKSRLPRTPWADGMVRLDDGLSNPVPDIRPPVRPDQKPAPSRETRPPQREVWPGLHN